MYLELWGDFYWPQAIDEYATRLHSEEAAGVDQEKNIDQVMEELT